MPKENITELFTAKTVNNRPAPKLQLCDEYIVHLTAIDMYAIEEAVQGIRITDRHHAEQIRDADTRIYFMQIGGEFSIMYLLDDMRVFLDDGIEIELSEETRTTAGEFFDRTGRESVIVHLAA